jgi:hypothetical protein
MALTACVMHGGLFIILGLIVQQSNAQSMSVTTLAGGDLNGTTAGSNNGVGSNALFNGPYGVAVDTFGTVYVVEFGFNKLRAIFPNRTVITVAGGGASGLQSGSNNGIGSNALFNQPICVSVDTFGTVYVVDYGNHKVRAIFPNRTVTTVVGGGASGTQSGSNNGIGTNALFNLPIGMSLDNFDTFYVADRINHKIRAIFPNRTVITVAGGGASGTQSGSNNGIGSNALFNQPYGVSVDTFGTVYVADRLNHKIRAIFPNRTVITVAGGGASGTMSESSNGIGSSALFNQPYGVYVDTFGILYVSDNSNNKIRAIFPNQTVITVAGGGASGTQSGSNNDIGSNALFNGPRGVAVDTFGTVYVADAFSHKIRTISRTCFPGSYVGLKNSCPPCGNGMFSGAEDVQSCALCPAGSVVSNSATSCDACAPGSFSSTAGSKNCTLCPSGTFASFPRSLSCQRCPAGHYCPANTSSWSRLNCGRGFFCPEGSGAPKPCPFQVPPVGGWGQLSVQGPAFMLETAGCINHCFWNFTSGDGVLSKCD